LFHQTERTAMKQLFPLIAALFLVPNGALAQDTNAGAALYDVHCAVCHGLAGRGNGPFAPALLLQPPALNDLATRHGEFPTARVVMRIDGRDPLVSHGSPMPIYGPFFEGSDTALKSETGQPIMTSRPIVDLVAYLRKIQE
jgi:mono/diheme cytochrome c family protein